MPTCKLCGKSGFFLVVDYHGVCTNCEQMVDMDVKIRERHILESVDIINKSTNLSTISSRYDFLLQEVAAMAAYEERGIRVKASDLPTYTEDLARLSKERPMFLRGRIQQLAEETGRKVQLAPTTTQKVNLLVRLIDQLQSLKASNSDHQVIQDAITNLKTQVQAIQYKAHLENAEKYEMKGNLKKAMECCVDALYFLTHDTIDDAEQREEINRLSAKIEELKSILSVKKKLK